MGRRSFRPRRWPDVGRHGSATGPFHLVSEELLLDRHWRNARTLASHNPRVYKARILGDWLINGKDPLPNIAKLGRGGQGN